jgi:hypothetical protein
VDNGANANIMDVIIRYMNLLLRLLLLIYDSPDANLDINLFW